MHHRYPHGTASHPNMLGATLLTGTLGTFLAALAIRDLVTAGTASLGGTLFAVTLLAIAGMSYRVHRKLKGMTPEGRDAYWRAFDEAHRENHERNVEMYVRRGRDGNGLG